ncbi:lysine-2,3-aminomutase-like protein [Parvularcula sp. LCG005]|uniref:lysine-2,3-aminomutase-like protein n=1 Tax=Parvularcula sp. LCG005 TaxID=3078805 RepID=UPI002942D47F|nr:lysine-2,3-aminomutase-like protein [Parvularcula sp. LCG005]WOI53011.1 lysine-2,3-aminomutase-like protein [Parvularcula sp. LCG005]
MTRTLKTLTALADADLLGEADDAALRAVAARYAIGVTPALTELMNGADRADPIHRQFIPSAGELITTPEERADPIGDHAHEPVPGLIHRYPDRVLLKIVSVCPVYCRFCFRREMVGPGKETTMSASDLTAALDYIRSNSGIWEVILTGGDPFMLSPARARAITEALEAIEHVKIIRWHTRMPVADPSRITDDYAAAVSSAKKAVYVAVHTNHAKELTAESVASCRRLHRAGITLVSQSVLLRGVNDDFDTMADLMRTLVASGIKPYYLHQLDYAPGTSHFRVPLREAQALVQRLRDELSGLCQPTFVIDIPGGVSKAVASLNDIAPVDDGHKVRGRDGAWRDYD